MQYALFDDIRVRASVETKPASASRRSKTVIASFKASAAEDAGLGGFCVANSHSGVRYAFSKTTIEEAMLYDKALFAVGSLKDGEMTVSSDPLALWFDGLPQNASLFVHILDAGQDCAEVLKDIGN